MQTCVYNLTYILTSHWVLMSVFKREKNNNFSFTAIRVFWDFCMKTTHTAGDAITYSSGKSRENPSAVKIKTSSYPLW